MKAAVIALAVLLLSSCSGGDSHPVPKRTAYPRTAVLPDSSVAVSTGPFSININVSATVSRPRPDWIDAEYRSLGATLHISATDHSDKADETNRRERISLNLGGASASVRSFTSPSGYRCEIVTTAEGPATPVQFIAVGDGQMLSGVFVLSGKTSPADSIRPIVYELEREATSILSSIGAP